MYYLCHYKTSTDGFQAPWAGCFADLFLLYMPMVRVELTWVAPVEFESTASTISPHRPVAACAWMIKKSGLRSSLPLPMARFKSPLVPPMQTIVSFPGGLVA